MEHVPRSTEHKHEFNNFATHYHMLLSKQIYTNNLPENKTQLFPPHYYINSFVRQLIARIRVFSQFTSFGLLIHFFAKRPETHMQNPIDRKKTSSLLGKPEPQTVGFGIGTNDN